MGQWLLLFSLLSQGAFANVAAEQLDVLLAKKTQYESSLLRELRQHYKLLFIFTSQCPHCQQLAPVIKDFVSTFHLELDAYSLDSNTLDELKAKPLSADLVQSLFVRGGYKPVVPALFLMNRYTLQTYAVLFGEAQPYQLAQRINELMHHIEESTHV